MWHYILDQLRLRLPASQVACSALVARLAAVTTVQVHLRYWSQLWRDILSICWSNSHIPVPLAKTGHIGEDFWRNNDSIIGELHRIFVRAICAWDPLYEVGPSQALMIRTLAKWDFGSSWRWRNISNALWSSLKGQPCFASALVKMKWETFLESFTRLNLCC